MAKIEEKVEELILGTINKLNYDLYDVEYIKEGKEYYLRVYIDNKDGINLEDCEKVTNSITDLLDTADYIKEQYFLEVSSPGVEKILKKDKHLKENINNNVQIKLFKALNGDKQFIGILNDFNNEHISLKIKDEEITIERKNISQIKTIYDW